MSHLMVYAHVFNWMPLLVSNSNLRLHSMRLYVVSDLHQEFAAFTPPKVDCDVVILAGDINLKRHGLHWAMAAFPDKPVLYVFGNHEFYGEKYPRLIEKGRDLVKGSNVRILENEVCEIDGWRFFGATLWSDYSLLGDPFDSIEAAQRVMTDFKKIRHWPTLKRFQPQHVRQAHVNSKNALRDFLQAGDRDRSVVITHHAPSARSLPEKFKADPVSGAYASNMDAFVEEMGPKLWIHGHIHTPSSYVIGSTMIMANPRGYPGETGFDPALVTLLK